MANKRIEKKMARKDVSASNVKQYSKPPKLIHGIDISDTNELSMSNMGRDFTGLMLTPNKLFAIWDNAANGDPSDQVALFNSILDRDGYIASLVATRIKSVKNKKWSVVGSNEAKREQIEKVLKGAKDVYASATGEENDGDNLWTTGGNLIGFSFDKMLSYLMLKPFFGYSGVKVDFGAGGEYINTFMPVAPENWRFTSNWGVYIQPAGGSTIYINGNKRYEYVMHMGSSDGRYGIPPTTGLCRPISYMYFRKSYAEMHQSRLLEKFGIPWVVSKLAPTDFNNPDTRMNIEKQLKNLAGDGAAVVTKDSELKLEGLGAASNSGVFLEAIKEIKESLAIAILGQQASVQQTGGFSNGQIQENVRNDITASDCKEIEDTITGLINTIEMNTWGTTECSFKIDYEGLADVEKLGKISDLANKAGLEVDEDYMRQAFSVPINKKKETATSNTISNILGGGNAQGGSMGLPTSVTESTAESALSSSVPAPENTNAPVTPEESVNTNPEAALAGLGTAALNDTVKKNKLIAFADISKDVVVNDYITSMINYSNIDDTLKRRLLYNMPVDTAKAISYLNDRLSNAILSESGNSDEINKLRFAIMAINPDSIYASVSKEMPVSKPIENKPSNESVAMADETINKPDAYGGSVPDFTSTPSNTAVDGGRDLAAEMISGTSAEHMPIEKVIPQATTLREQPVVYAPDTRTIEEKRAEYRKVATRINDVAKRVDKLDELARASISAMEMGVGGIQPSGIQMPERKKITAEEAERIAYNENQQKLNDAVSQLALQHYMKENLDITVDDLVEDFMSGIPSAFQRLPLIKNTSWNIYNQMLDNLKQNSAIIDNAKYAVEKNHGNMPSWANQISTSAQYSVLNTALNYWYNKRPKNKESGELLRAIKNTAKQATASLLNTTESAINTFLPKLVSADGWVNLEDTTNAYVANNVDKVMTSQEAKRYKGLNSADKVNMLNTITAKLLELRNRDSNTYNEKEKSIVSDLNKWYDNSERTRILSRNYALQNNFIKGRNLLEQNYYDVIRTATDMITAMSIGAGLGAISKLKYASGLGNFATFGALSNYDIYSEMYANGKSRDESALIAATVSPIIGLLDKLETTIAFGKGAGVLEKEELRKLMKDVSGIWQKTLINKAKTIGINIASETGIETLQGFVQEMARYLASDEAFKNNNDEQIVKAIMDMAVKYGQDIPADELKALVDNLRSAYNKDKLNYRGNVNFMEVLSNTFEQGLSAAMVMPAIVILGHKVNGSGRTMKDIEKNTRRTMAQIREDAQNKKDDLLNTKKELSQQLDSDIPVKNKTNIENNIFKINQEVESLDRINDYAKNLQNKFQSGMSAFEADTLLKNYMNFEVKGDTGVAIRNALADTLGIDTKNMSMDELATLTDIAEDVVLLDNNSLTEQNGKRMFKVGDQLYDENWNGSYDTGDGKIYLNLNKAKTPEALNTFFKGVVRHEMTHKGLAGIKNKTATALFRDVWANMNDVEKYNIAKDYVQHYQPTSINEDGSVNMDRVNNENNKALQDLLAEEYLGKQSENYSGFIKTPIGKRAYYKIKEIWRMIAPKASFSDKEIASILVEARKNIPQNIIESRYKQAIKDESELLESIKESPDKIPTDLVDIERIEELGYTTNPEDAGWITPDGKMINLNRSDANMENRLDHRTITKSGESSLGMMQFMNAGYIRYSPENNAFEIAKKPTPEQLLTIKRILSSTTKNPRVAIEDMKNKIGKDGVYEFEETVTDYDNTYNADELISNIEQAYTSKNIQDKYESPLLPFLKPSIAGDINSVNFKNWFGDWKNNPEQASKVVDKDGKPLVVYHGTGQEFNTFRITDKMYPSDMASFFTENKKIAEFFADVSGSDIVMPVYLKIKKIANLGNINDEITVKELFNRIGIENVSIPTKIENLKKPIWRWYNDDKYVLNTIKKSGFDGFTGIEKGSKMFGVFEPTQIKSAIGNIGTYDVTNPDIRYSIDNRSVGKQAYREVMDRIEKENPIIHALISAGIKKVYLPDYKGKAEDIKGTWFTTNPNLGTPINDVAGLLTNYLDMNEEEIVNKLDELKDLTYGQYKKSMAEETKQEKEYWENMAEKAGVDIKNTINPDDFFLDDDTVDIKKKKEVEDFFDQMFIENLGNKIPIAQMKDSDYEAQYKINTLNDKKINALKDVETAVQPNSDIAIKDSIADKWLTMSPEEKTNYVEDVYDKAVEEVYNNSTLAFMENDFDKAFISLIKYMERNIPSPLYVDRIYFSHDKTTIILHIKSRINDDYSSYIRVGGVDESGNGEYINELDSTIKSDLDSVYGVVIDVDEIMDFVNKEAKQELAESTLGDVIEKDANIGMTIDTIKKMLGQDVVTEKTLQLLKDIAENKTEKESIINPNANRVRMPAMTLIQFLDGLNTAIKEGESRRDFNYNNNLIARQNVYDFIDEHIMFDRVREKIKKDVNKIDLLSNTPEQYFAKVKEIINGYNNIVDISKDVEKNVASAAEYIKQLYPNREDYPIVRALNAKLSHILATVNDKTLRSGKELKEISNLIAVAEQYNTINHAQDNRTNITAQSKLVDGYAEGKNDWKRFIGGKVNYLIELLRQNRNNKAIRNKIITTIRSIANIATPEGADKTLATFDDEINTIINSENLRNSANNIIKTVKEMKRLGTRANDFYNLFTNIRASMPKALSISAVLDKKAPVIISAVDVADIKTKLNNRMSELIKSSPEEYAELSEILAKFYNITADTDGNINLSNLTADELESLNQALVSLGTMASTDFKDFKNQLKKDYAEMENLVLPQVATAALLKGRTTLPRVTGIGGRAGNILVRQDIIKNVGEAFLNYLYTDASDNLANINKHNAKVNEEISKLDENSADDISKIDALRNEIITETAIAQDDLNLLNNIFGKKYSKTLVGSSVEEIGALSKVLNYKADTLLNSDEEFQNKTGQSVKLLAIMFDNIYNTMKYDRVNFMNAINKIIGNKKPSPMIMNTIGKAVNKPLTSWTVSDFEALGALVARYSIDKGLASQQYIDENPVDIGILNMFSPKVFEKQGGKISKNLMSVLNNMGFRQLKDFAGLDSSVIANIISLEENGKIMKTFYSNFQDGEDESIRIADTFSDGFYESLPQNIKDKFSEKDVERMSQYLTSVGWFDKHRNLFARLTPENKDSFINKIKDKISNLATVKQQKVKLLTNQGVKNGVDINNANEKRNESTEASFTEAEAMHVYAMMYADKFNKPEYHFIKDSNDGIVINRGGGKMFGDAGDLQNLTNKELGVPLNTTNANIIVNQMLSPEQKRYVELLVERYNKVISPLFREEYSKATGKAMPEYNMYLPALRYIREPQNKEVGKSSLGSFSVGGVGLDQDGRLKDKVENANAPLIIKDFFALMAETVQFSANYIAFRKALQDLDNVVSNKNIQTMLDGIPGYGKAMKERLKQFEERITGKTLGSPNEYNWLERMMQNIIQTNLFLRPRSIMSQLASVPMALRYGDISAGDRGLGDIKAIGDSVVRALSFTNNGYLPWRKGEEYMLDELKHYSGSVYRRIISGYINGVIDNNPQNYHLVNALTGHRDDMNRLLALQFYFDRASMAEIAFNSIKYQMEKNNINYDEALKIAKYKSLYNSHDDRIERIAIEEKYLEEYKKQLNELNPSDANYAKSKSDLGEYILSAQKDIADLKAKQTEFNKLYNEYNTPEMQDKLDKYDIAMRDAATRIKKQFETQSMTSILYSPPINEAGILRVILPLAYRNSWNRRLISIRNLLNVARNRILRGDSDAVKEYSNIARKEIANMLISGLYMALVDMIFQSFWFDDDANKWKNKFIGKGFAENARIKDNINKFIAQWVYEATQASSSMLPFLSESLESGYLSLVGGDAYNPIKGIFGNKPEKMVKALMDLISNGKADKATLQAIAFLIESLSGIPASRIIGATQGTIGGTKQATQIYEEARDAWKNYDASNLRIRNMDGTYKYDSDYEKFMIAIRDRMLKEGDKEGASEIDKKIQRAKDFVSSMSNEKTTMPFADANAVRIANSLIDQKNAISKLTNAYEITKRQIEPYIKVEPVIVPNKGSVFFVNGSVSDRLDADLVLQGLIKIAKVSPDIAKALLKKWSIPRNMSQYVKISNKDYITTGAK